jgi:hypothetical protein
LVKFNQNGNRLWGTYYGGVKDEGADQCAFVNDNIYLMGYTASNKSISTPGSPQTTYGGGFTDGFVAKFSMCDIDISVVQNGPTLTLNETSGIYQWMDCNDNYALILGETNRSFTPSKNGTYAAQITKNGCTTISSCISFQSLGLNDKESISDFRIYPNPTNNLLFIEFNSDGLEKELTILNSTGQTIMERLVSNEKIVELDLRFYQPGLYLVKISSSKGEETHRIVKE